MASVWPGSVAETFPDLAIPRTLGAERAPSPLEPNDVASRELGVELWVKREDLLDDFGSGHKARKLGYVVADAVEEKATVLVTAASIPSSQAVGVVRAALRNGMRAHVVYCGDRQVKPFRPHGNYLLVALFGATVTWHERSEWDSWPDYVEEASVRERNADERPYVVTPGISNWPGVLGSVELGIELAGQLPDDGTPVHVVAAAGSGGTCLGLAIAGWALERQWRIHGVCIGGSLEATEGELARLQAQAAGPLGIPMTRMVRLHEGNGGRGYDVISGLELEVMRSAMVRYGLLLDPTYMAKAFLGLRQLVGSGLIPRGSRVVLVHTGGTLGIFGSEALRGWSAGALSNYLAGAAKGEAP